MANIFSSFFKGQDNSNKWNNVSKNFEKFTTKQKYEDLS